MSDRARVISGRIGAAALLLLSAGCVIYEPAYRSYGHADSGIYIHETPAYRAGTASVGFADPAFYPYWTLDHFYFGGFHRHHRFYSPAFSYYPAPLYRSPFHARGRGFGLSVAFGHPFFHDPFFHGFHPYGYRGHLYLTRTFHRPRLDHRPSRHHRPRASSAGHDPRRDLRPPPRASRAALIGSRSRAGSTLRSPRAATSRTTIVRTTPHPATRGSARSGRRGDVLRRSRIQSASSHASTPASETRRERRRGASEFKPGTRPRRAFGRDAARRDRQTSAAPQARRQAPRAQRRAESTERTRPTRRPAAAAASKSRSRAARLERSRSRADDNPRRRKRR